jgi:hypothetical protein
VVVIVVMAPVAAPVMIPFALPIPPVVMLKPAVIAMPVARKEPLAIVMRCYPFSPRIRQPCPITFMPLVSLPHWIPITGYPNELRGWSWRQNANHYWRRRRANTDSDGDVGTEYRCAGQQHHDDQCCPNEALHIVLISLN